MSFIESIMTRVQRFARAFSGVEEYGGYRPMRDPLAVLFGQLAQALSLAAVLLMLAAVVLVFVSSKRTDSMGPPMTLVIGVGCLVGNLGLESLAAKYQQHHNRATAFHDERGYFLYLRSLRAKSLQSVTHSGGAANPLPDAFVVDDVLEELGTALANVGTLFIIGSKETGSMAWSPTTILLRSTDRTWRLLFARLARGARAIFILPGETPGITEELMQITEQRLLHKMIVIMSPATGRDSRHALWDSIAAKLAGHGWRLPSFVEEGMVYAPSESLAPRCGLPYVVNGKRSLGAALRSLLAEVAPGEPASSAMAEVEAIEQGAA
jgi:hypothetical protein